MSSFLENHARTHTCGELRLSDEGSEVVLTGWVNSLRDHGGRRFIDLRDRFGITQIVFKPETGGDVHALAHDLRREWCIGIAGRVETRTGNGGESNPKLSTGEVEIDVQEICIFNKSPTPPFEIRDEIDTSEDKRLEYRSLDLRRKPMQDNLLTRHTVSQATRNFLSGIGFLEVETPTLVKYTPGGARNFLTPSRLSPGGFYALAESPQLYKQMLMMGGLDRYFQIARCFRDEALRGDRQLEFTQIDMEMSFVNERDIQTVVEGLIREIFHALKGPDLEPIPRISYDESMSRFGTDKPDLRYGLELTDLTEVVRTQEDCAVPLFKEALEQGGIVKALVIPAAYKLARREIEQLEPVAVQYGGKGLGRAKIGEDGASWTQSPFSKMIKPEALVAITEACQAKPGDLILFQFGKAKLVNMVLSGLRIHIAEQFKLADPTKSCFVWITEFPLFEYSEVEGAFVAAHHPFTSPQIGHEDIMVTEPQNCRSRAYDLVLNGVEIGGGSVRIHDSDVQTKVFEALGISEEERQEKFGFLLETLRYGAPPHAGIALGLDRLCMLLCGANSIRDVIAFPKTQSGTDPVTAAPTGVSDEQLKELHIMSTVVKD